MNLEVEITKRVRRDHSPFKFMPDDIPPKSKVMVFWDSYGNKKSVNKQDAIKLLERTLKELKE